MDLNKVTLIGNMVRDPEARRLSSGQQIVRFSLATNYAWRTAGTSVQREAVDFHDCLAWGTLADVIASHLRKGAKVYVEGRLHASSVVTRDGHRRTRTNIVVEYMIMLSQRSRQAGSESTATINAKLVREDVDVNDVEDGGP